MTSIVQKYYEKTLNEYNDETPFLTSHLSGAKASTSCSVDTLMKGLSSKIVLKNIPVIYEWFEPKTTIKVLTWQQVVTNNPPKKRLLQGFLKDARGNDLLSIYQNLSLEWLTALSEELSTKKAWSHHPWLSYYAHAYGLDVPLCQPEVFSLSNKDIRWLLATDLPSPWNGDTVLPYLMFRNNRLTELMHNIQVLSLLKISLVIDDVEMCEKTLHYVLNYIDEKYSDFSYLPYVGNVDFCKTTTELVQHPTYQKMTNRSEMLDDFLTKNEHIALFKTYKNMGISLGDMLFMGYKEPTENVEICF